MAHSLHNLVIDKCCQGRLLEVISSKLALLLKKYHFFAPESRNSHRACAVCSYTLEDCKTSTTQTSTIPDIHHTEHPPHQTSTKPDIHHTVSKIGHPPHQTSTTPDIHQTRHPPHQTSTTPDIHRTVCKLGPPPHHNVTWCGGCPFLNMVWWRSSVVDV